MKRVLLERTDSKMDEAGTRTEFLTRSHQVWEALLLLLTNRMSEEDTVLVVPAKSESVWKNLLQRLYPKGEMIAEIVVEFPNNTRVEIDTEESPNNMKVDAESSNNMRVEAEGPNNMRVERKGSQGSVIPMEVPNNMFGIISEGTHNMSQHPEYYATEYRDYRTVYEVVTGDTPDISALLPDSTCNQTVRYSRDRNKSWVSRINRMGTTTQNERGDITLAIKNVKKFVQDSLSAVEDDEYVWPSYWDDYEGNELYERKSKFISVCVLDATYNTGIYDFMYELKGNGLKMKKQLVEWSNEPSMETGRRIGRWMGIMTEKPMRVEQQGSQGSHDDMATTTRDINTSLEDDMDANTVQEAVNADTYADAMDYQEVVPSSTAGECQTDISGRTVAVKAAVPVTARINRTSSAARSERGDTAFIDNHVNHVNGIVMNHSLAVEKEELSLEYNYASGMSYGDVRKESQVNMD